MVSGIQIHVSAASRNAAEEIVRAVPKPWVCASEPTTHGARALATRRARGEAATEELRQAVVNYRALFEDLLATDKGTIRRAS